MDLVSHDMLNDNQAVLSYLELILAMPGLDKKAAEYAKKAISHVRSSTMHIENVKTIVTPRRATAAQPETTDLLASIKGASDELGRHFPNKKIKVNFPHQPGKALVAGGGLIKKLLETVMSSVVKLDLEAEVALNVSVSEEMSYGNRCWNVKIEDPNVKVPAVVTGADIDSVHTQDSSRVVKMSGLLFAKMAAEGLGGAFEVESDGGPDKGAVFVVRLRRAGNR